MLRELGTRACGADGQEIVAANKGICVVALLGIGFSIRVFTAAAALELKLVGGSSAGISPWACIRDRKPLQISKAWGMCRTCAASSTANMLSMVRSRNPVYMYWRSG